MQWRKLTLGIQWKTQEYDQNAQVRKHYAMASKKQMAKKQNGMDLNFTDTNASKGPHTFQKWTYCVSTEHQI